MEKDRLSNIDLYKIVCIFSVIILHVASANAFDLTVSKDFENNFAVINFYNMITRFCVPGFLMISGMFLLDKDISIRDIFKKYILRIVIIYIIFGCFYSLFHLKENNNNFWYSFISGYYHLWYLYLIIGIYLVIPFLRKIVLDKNLIVYFLILCLLFSGCMPVMNEFIKSREFNIALSNFNINMPLGYVGYVVAGYYFSKNNVNNNIFYCLGIIGFISNYILYYFISYNTDLYSSIFLMPGTIFQSIATFLIFKNLKIKRNKFFSFISDLVFGIYLVHVFIMSILLKLNQYIIVKYSIISIPLISIIIFIISFLITIILRKLPILKKYL